jgi:hypothetical protein
MPILKPAVEPPEEESVEAVVAADVESLVVLVLWLLLQLIASTQSALKLKEASLLMFVKNFKNENKG